MKDAIIAGPLKPGTVQHMRRAPAVQLFENVALLPPVASEVTDRPADA